MTSSLDSQQLTLQQIDEALRTRYWVWTLMTEHETQAGLLTLLKTRLPHIATDSWPARFDFGGIYVNGIEARSDQKLPTPCRVEYYEPKFDIADAHLVFPQYKPEYVVYRDDFILVAYKPPGLSSMPAKEQRHFSLKASLEALVGRSIHMPSRLDVSAQGIVIVSISEVAHAHLQRSFESRQVNKTYLCASANRPSWDEKTVTAAIGRDPLHPVLRTTAAQHGQQAETCFRYLAQSPKSDLPEHPLHILIAKPKTGRTHQIRVHAAHEHIPLIGDRFYGGAHASELHLLSTAITCIHPVSQRAFTCTLPHSLRPRWASDITIAEE